MKYIFPNIIIIAAAVLIIRRHSFDRFRNIIFEDRRAVSIGLIVTFVAGIADVLDSSRANFQNIASIIIAFFLRFLLVSVIVHYIWRPRRGGL